jgi:hypothetical protein
VLIANDAERVQNSCSIQLLTAVLILASIAAGQMFNSLAQTLFPIKFKFYARDSLVMAAGPFLHMRKAAHHGNHICFFLHCFRRLPCSIFGASFIC